MKKRNRRNRSKKSASKSCDYKRGAWVRQSIFTMRPGELTEWLLPQTKSNV